MRLSVSVIAAGKYWRAGEEVPDELVPPEFATRYRPPAVVAEEPPVAPTHIKIGRTWQRIAPGEQAPPGEGWIRKGKGFVRAGQ